MHDRNKITAAWKEVLPEWWNTFVQVLTTQLGRVHRSVHPTEAIDEDVNMNFLNRIHPSSIENNHTDQWLTDMVFEELSFETDGRDIVPIGCGGMIEVSA